MAKKIYTTAPLFEGISSDEVEMMLPCLDTQRKQYDRGEYVLRSGQSSDRFGVMVSGRAHVEVTDAWGNIAVLEVLEAGDLFAHGYACSMQPLDIDVIADARCEVLMIKAEHVIRPCPNQCSCHGHIASNLMRSLAQRNLDMNRRAIAMAPKTIRGKILAYLSQQKKLAGSSTFTIPYSQTKLANYLSVDRSALSNELSKLRREGIVDYQGTTYKLP